MHLLYLSGGKKGPTSYKYVNYSKFTLKYKALKSMELCQYKLAKNLDQSFFRSLPLHVGMGADHFPEEVHDTPFNSVDS